MFSINILLVEDDKDILEMLKDFLETENYNIITAEDGEEACEKFSNNDVILVLLDLMIPKISGMEVMKYIRKSSNVPIIIVSAKDSDSDKTIGLGLGADDYITKPFSVTEVLARIKSNIRRSTEYSTKKKEEDILEIGSLKMDFSKFSLYKNNIDLELTYKEFEILKLFLTNPGKVYTKEQLYRLVWKEEYYGDENAINVHISRLRNKIEDDPKKPKIIITVWGIGYKLGEFNE